MSIWNKTLFGRDLLSLWPLHEIYERFGTRGWIAKSVEVELSFQLVNTQFYVFITWRDSIERYGPNPTVPQIVKPQIAYGIVAS